MEKPNILLLTIDCLRADHLGCYGYSRDTSPNIDRLASKGALFLEAISNGGRTPASFPSILASQLPPLEWEEHKQIMQRAPTLAGILKKAGYQTAAFLSNPFLTKFFHYDKGFNVFEDDLGIISDQTLKKPKRALLRKSKVLGKIRILLGRILNLTLFWAGKQRDATAEKLTGRAVSWLKNCPSSFFLWSHFMDAHYPYLPPSKYVHQICNRHISKYRIFNLYYRRLKSLRIADFRNADWLSQSEIDTLIDLYDANIRYIDDSIGKLLDSLGSRLKNTIIIITADHGEAFGEHNSLGHCTLFEELVHVPLIMVGPGIKAATIVNEPVNLLDLAPTITDLVGIDSIKGFRGRSLLPVVSGEEGVTDGTIMTNIIYESRLRLLSYRTPEWKYIRTESMDEAGTVLSEEVYDLRNDPKEKYNLQGSENGHAKTFELEAVNKILEFKRLKREEKIAYEKERIKERLSKLPKL